MNFRSLLETEDPFSKTLIETIITHREEDIFVDYKESFDPQDEKHWLGLTMDAIAFANTMGGYLVFGIKDIDFVVTGLDSVALSVLTNTSTVLQKLNRYVAPPFTQIRTKRFETSAGNLAVIYVPESKGRTHVVVREANIRYPNGATKILLRPGMIFVRRSATNQILEPEDFEQIINRRIDYFKESLLGKIGKIMEAPPDHQVLVFDPNPKTRDGRTFVISDSPDSIPVKGMSFTITPRTDQEELLSWIAIAGRDSLFQPRKARLWHLYFVRMILTLSKSTLEHLVKFCLIGDVPVFYWLKNIEPEDAKRVLYEIFVNSMSMGIKTDILHIAAFYGKTFHRKLLNKLGKDIGRLAPRSRCFPKEQPICLFFQEIVNGRRRLKGKIKEEDFRKELEISLTDLAGRLSEGKGGLFEIIEAKSIDCYLYAHESK